MGRFGGLRLRRTGGHARAARLGGGRGRGMTEKMEVRGELERVARGEVVVAVVVAVVVEWRRC